MNTWFNHYEHTPADLFAACERGAANLRTEAAEALASGDTARHDRKIRAAEFVDTYAETIQSGTANLDHAQVIAHAANMGGLLVNPRIPDPPRSSLDSDSREIVGIHRSELQAAAAAGLLRLVADPNQLAYYVLPGYEPEGYDPATRTTSLARR